MRRTLTPAGKRPRLRSQADRHVTVAEGVENAEAPAHAGWRDARGWTARGRVPGQAFSAGRSGSGNRQRPVALRRRRCREHAIFPARPGHASELRDAQGSLAVQPARRRRSHDRASHAKLCRRQAPERRRAAASRRVHGPDERQAAVELRRARDLPLEVLDAHGLRQGRRVPRDQRSRRRLHCLAGLLSLCVGRGDREAARELGTAGVASRVPQDRCRRSASRT